MGKGPSARERLAEARLQLRKPMEVHVPDLLWKDRSLPEGARYLWAFLWMLRIIGRRFTFAELRDLSGLSQHSVVKYLNQLTERGWLEYCRSGRTVEVRLLWPVACDILKLQDDILLDRSLPHAARWVWGVIRGLDRQFTYQMLMERTGYSRNSLIKYLRVLSESGYLEGAVRRIARKKHFAFAAENPAEGRRREEVAVFEKDKSLVGQKPGYSFGQFLMARKVELRTGTYVVENGELNYLVNRKTGGRLQYDVLLPKYNAALEFQGPQHFRVTRLYPSETQLRLQQERDRLKRTLSAQAGIKLAEIHPRNLTFEYLDRVLTEMGVPLRPVPDEKRYVYQALLRYSEQYRAKVLQEEHTTA